VSPRKPELFQDVLEDDLGGRAASPKQRVGGASLSPDEFGGTRPQEDVVDRFNILRAEEEAFRNQAQRDSRDTRRLRWTGTMWLVGVIAALGLAAVGYNLLARYGQRAAQRELAGAAAAHRSAEEERMLRMQKIATPTPPPPAPSKP
jgi:hypothetical protein